MTAEIKPRHTAGSFRELWHVALPLILSSGSLSLMQVLDRIFLTWYSTDALAAALPAGVLHWTVMSVALGTATYLNTFVAQYEGAGQKDRASASIWQGVYLSLFVGPLFLLVVPFSPSIFRIIGHAADVQVLENAYFSVLCSGAFVITLSAGLACFYSGRGETRIVMWVNIAAMLFNGVLDYCLIFGVGPFPRWGIRGAAVATVLANVVAALLYIAMLMRSRERVEYRFWQTYRFDRELFARLLRYGLPTGLQFMLDASGFALFVFLIGAIGKTELAATSLAFNVNSMAFIPMMGVGTAVMTIVGKRIGEGRPELAVRTTWLASGVVSAYTLAFVAMFVCFPGIILSAYGIDATSEEYAPIYQTVVTLLQFVAVYCFFDGLAIVFGSAVRGAGDTRFSLVFTFLTGWLLMVVPTMVTSWKFGGSLMLSWVYCSVYIIVLGLGYMLRFQAGRWKSMRVIEFAPPAAELDSV